MGILNIDKTITVEDLLDSGFKSSSIGYYKQDDDGNIVLTYAKTFVKRVTPTVRLQWGNKMESFTIPLKFTYYWKNCTGLGISIPKRFESLEGYISVKIDTDNYTSKYFANVDESLFKDFKKIEDVYDLSAFVMAKNNEVLKYIQDKIS